jgi:hypothetical protein
MKRLIACTLALILAGPVISNAQTDDQYRQNSQYQNVEDGQFLKLVSYILNPVGMALEWGLMRPLHNLATKSSVAPLLSGDSGPSFFSENNNASKVPPGTFAPTTINPTNNLEASNSDQAVVPVAPAGTTPPPAQTSPPSKGPARSGQPVFH